LAQKDKPKEPKLPEGCTDGQVAKWDAATRTWVCDGRVTDLENAVVGLDNRVADLEDHPNPDPPCFDYLNRYVDCGNGTVTDTVTGLIWLQNPNCFGLQDWPTANESAAGLADGQCGLGDHSKPGDWRVPSKEEWEATIAQALILSCTNPSLTDRAGTSCFATDPPFSGVQNIYWTSTTLFGLPNSARIVLLDVGVTNAGLFKTFTSSVWPVRDP
jgi:hypothetical protein